MHILTFDQIYFRIKSKSLPAQYTLTPTEPIKFSRFFDAICSIGTVEALLYFIEKVCDAKNIILKSNQHTYVINGLSDFLSLYFDKGFYKEELSPEQNDAVEGLLKKVTFTKDQLISLLKRISPNELQYFLDNYTCFSKKDLLAIANDLDTVKRLSVRSIVILFFYFNPRGQATYATPLLDIYYYAYRVGHIVGIKDGIAFRFNGFHFQLETEGEFAATSLRHLTDYVQLYHTIYPSPLFAKILAVFKLSDSVITPCHNAYKEYAEFTFLDKYNNNELIYFSSGWDGHIVGLALYGDYFIYANRGIGGAQDTGCRIFKIKDKKLITPDLIRKLIRSYFASQYEFHELLATFIDFDLPVVCFASQKQKYDTCSFVNPKAMIEALLFILQLPANVSVDALVSAFSTADRKDYKLFTEFVRNAEIDHLIQRMSYAQDAYLIRFYAQLIKEIIYQHHGYDLEREKDVKEFERASYLYEHTSQPVKALMETDNDFVTFIEDMMLVPKPVVFSNPPPKIPITVSESAKASLPAKIIMV